MLATDFRSARMSETQASWKVLPHGKLSEIDENILTVTGTIEMPLMQLPRRMTVVRLADSRLVVYSAIALDEAGMKTIEDYGEPGWLVVPNDHHRLDAGAWKQRFPQLRVVAPEGSRKNTPGGRGTDWYPKLAYGTEG